MKALQRRTLDEQVPELRSDRVDDGEMTACRFRTQALLYQQRRGGKADAFVSKFERAYGVGRRDSFSGGESCAGGINEEFPIGFLTSNAFQVPVVEQLLDLCAPLLPRHAAWSSAR